MTIRNSFPDVRPALNLDFANTKRLDPRITFTRSSTGTYVDEFGVIKTAASNEARFDHDGSGNSLGLLIEENRTNLYANSNSATGTAATVTLGGGSSPNGGTDAILLTANTTNGYVQANTTFTVSTVSDHTISFWYKNGTGTATVIRIEGVLNGGGKGYFFFNDLDDGSNVTTHTTHTSNYGIQDFPGGWKRFYMGYNSSSGTNATGTFTCRILVSGIANTETCYLFGLQAEAGSFPTSYIPTSGSTATRSADVASMTGTNFSSWYTQTAGSFIATWDQSINSSGSLTMIAEGATPYEVSIYTASGLPQFAMYLSHVHQNNYAQSPSVAIPVNTLQTIGGSYDSSGVTAVLNGDTPVTTGSSISVNEGATLIRFGARNNGTFYINGHLSRFTYYDRRLTDAQLQALTL